MQGHFAASSRPVFWRERELVPDVKILSPSHTTRIFLHTKHLLKYSTDTVLLWLEDKNFEELKKLAEEIIIIFKPLQ